MNRRRVAWLALPLLPLAACAGRAAEASSSDEPTPIACQPGAHRATPEDDYVCADGAWTRGVAPTTTAPARPVPPEALPLPIPSTTAAPTTTTTAPATRVPATTAPA